MVGRKEGRIPKSQRWHFFPSVSFQLLRFRQSFFFFLRVHTETMRQEISLSKREIWNVEIGNDFPLSKSRSSSSGCTRKWCEIFFSRRFVSFSFIFFLSFKSSKLMWKLSGLCGSSIISATVFMKWDTRLTFLCRRIRVKTLRGACKVRRYEERRWMETKQLNCRGLHWHSQPHTKHTQLLFGVRNKTRWL